jgi:hypothetical protein
MLFSYSTLSLSTSLIPVVTIVIMLHNKKNKIKTTIVYFLRLERQSSWAGQWPGRMSTWLKRYVEIMDEELTKKDTNL